MQAKVKICPINGEKFIFFQKLCFRLKKGNVTSFIVHLGKSGILHNQNLKHSKKKQSFKHLKKTKNVTRKRDMIKIKIPYKTNKMFVSECKRW